MAENLKEKDEVGEGLLRDGVSQETNNEKFNRLLNRCKQPRRVYLALIALAKPGVKQTDDMLEKRKILIRDLLAGLDIAQSDKQVV